MPRQYLAPEILDYIVDFLHDEKQALKSCCLASKSWIQRTRKHLFADIELYNKMHLQSWKDTFLDPATSPARYTKTLSICPYHVTAEDVGWIRTFTSVRRFKMDSTLDFYADDTKTSLIPFYAFSPAVESFHVDVEAVSLSRIFNLALTFPLLHSLEVSTRDTNYDEIDHTYYDSDEDPDDGSSNIPRPSNLPVLTGTLMVSIATGLKHIAPMLLSLHLHPRKLDITCQSESEDVKWTEALLEECISTVETLNVYLTHNYVRLDISRARKLKKLQFVCAEPDVKWVIDTLQTLAPDREHLQVSVVVYHASAIHHNRPILREEAMRHPYYTNFVDALGTALYARWLDLDKLFVQLSESRFIRPKIFYYEPPPVEERWGKTWLEQLLPEATKIGVVDRAAFEKLEDIS